MFDGHFYVYQWQKFTKDFYTFLNIFNFHYFKAFEKDDAILHLEINIPCDTASRYKSKIWSCCSKQICDIDLIYFLLSRCTKRDFCLYCMATGVHWSSKFISIYMHPLWYRIALHFFEVSALICDYFLISISPPAVLLLKCSTKIIKFTSLSC